MVWWFHHLYQIEQALCWLLCCFYFFFYLLNRQILIDYTSLFLSDFNDRKSMALYKTAAVSLKTVWRVGKDFPQPTVFWSLCMFKTHPSSGLFVPWLMTKRPVHLEFVISIGQRECSRRGQSSRQETLSRDTDTKKVTTVEGSRFYAGTHV